MPFVQAKCPECGGMLAVDDSKKAAICQFCGEAFIVQEAIINNNTYITNDNRTTHNYGDGAVVNVYEDTSKDFVIEAGVLKEYHGASVDVVIPDGVIEIGTECFKYLKIKSVTIPCSVTIIGGAFHNCSNLDCINVNENNINYSSVDGVLFNKDKTTLIRYPINKIDTKYIIPDSVTNIDYCAFSGSFHLSEVIIPDSVTSIGGSAFYSCTSLTSSTIPDSVTSIKDSAFCYCSNLTTITISDTMRITKGVFGNCDSLTSINISNTGETLNKQKFLEKYDFIDKYDNYTFGDNDSLEKYYDYSYSKDVIIPSGFKSIGRGAFQYDKSIVSITIPDGVTSIEDEAFIGCENLTSITLPDSVTKIADKAFYDCKSLTSITIPKGVTIIESDTFYGCTKLASLVIPDSVTTIRNQAFAGCKSLASLVIPNSVKDIGYEAFRSCCNLKSVTILGSDVSIGEKAFSDCASLTSVTIPDSVTDIHWEAFENAPWDKVRVEKAFERCMAERKSKGLCQHCGGKFKGLFSSKCSNCGKPKDY